MKKHLRKILITLGIITVAYAGAPVDVGTPWLYSYGTMEFNTPNGELRKGEFAVVDGQTFINFSGETIDFEEQHTYASTSGFTEVTFVGTQYFDNFADGKVKVDEKKYKEEKRNPKKTKLRLASWADASIGVLNSSSATTTYANSVTLAIDCTGTDAGLLTFVANRTLGNITGATYAGASMTEKASSTNNNVTGMVIFSKTAPTTGTNNTVISLNDYRINTVYQTCLSGTDQTDVVEATKNTAATYSTTITDSVTTVTNNAWVFSGVSLQDAYALTPSGSQIEVYDVDHSNSNMGQTGVSYIEKVTAGSQIMASTWSTSGNSAQALVVVKPSASGGSTCTYSGTGNWNVLYSDNCEIGIDVNIASGSVMAINRDGAGSFQVTNGAKVSGMDGVIYIQSPNSIVLNSTVNGVIYKSGNTNVPFTPTIVYSPANPVQDRAVQELKIFTNWLKTNNVRGFVGEVGIPNDADTDLWNGTLQHWFRQADKCELWVTGWASGEWWGTTYLLSIYNENPSGTWNDETSTAIFEAFPTVGTVGATTSSNFSRGVNVSGAEFGDGGGFCNNTPGTHNSQYHYDQADSYQAMADAGHTIVRIPFRWERIQPTLNSALDSTELNLLIQAVGRAGDAGLKVILDVHNYAEYKRWNGSSCIDEPIGSTNVPATAYYDLWERLSTSFVASSTIAAYDIMNEPANVSAANWETYSDGVLDAIRAQGDNTLILVPGAGYSGAQDWETNHSGGSWITDSANNFLYQAHHYLEYNHSGSYNNTFDQEITNAVSNGYATSSSAGSVYDVCSTN